MRSSSLIDLSSLTSPAVVRKDVAWDSALALAQISKLVYGPNVAVESALLEAGFGRATAIENGPQFAWIASHPDAVVVAFRGTNERADWIANIDVRPMPVRHGRLHRGFYDGYYSLMPNIEKEVAQVLKAGAKLWVTGHSLGGALSIVCVYDFWVASQRAPFGVYTFGQPRVVAGELTNIMAERLGKDYVRFVNEGDIVTRIPPFYHHFGHRVLFRPGRVESAMEEAVTIHGVIESQAVPDELEPLDDEEFRELQESIRRHTGSIVTDSVALGDSIPMLNDHSMDEYIRKLVGQLSRFNSGAIR